MSATDTSLTQLRCEYLGNPLGIDERSPRLSWQMLSARRGARQLAYRIWVGDSLAAVSGGKGNLWDSGRVETAESTQIVYAGRPLHSRELCHWMVEIWDETGASIRSTPAFWSMGLLEKGDWSARWIAADPEILRRDRQAVTPSLTEPGTPALFRREFDITAPVKRATLYATARGIFELRANGRRISDDVFAPEWTDYHKRIQYRSYDVTPLIFQGTNALAATLGDGWWSGYVGWQETRCRYGSLENSLMLQLEVELMDGKRLVIGTDSSWRSNTGPILSSDFMMGESYDARREHAGWDKGSFSDQSWLPSLEVPAPSSPLVSQPSEPVRIVELRVPVSVNEIRPGVFIFDFGQNISGWARLQLSGLPAGSAMVLRHGERLNPDGTLYVENLRRAKATDTYIARGGDSETYEPHFTFHGFQYVELTGFVGKIGEGMLTACVVHSATPAAGHFECSHAGVNRLWLNGLWSQRDNFISVPTDCPQRDERLGWMGDAQVFLRTATYNMDVAAFFTKWMKDVEDAQTPEGIFPDVAPRVGEKTNFVGLDDLCGAAGWADAGIVVPWTIWRMYGDRRIIERHWRAMCAWVDYLDRTNPDGLRTRDLHNNYGDWLCIPTDTTFRTHSPMKNLLATAYWADDAAKLSRMARELGREAEARKYQAMFLKVKAAFQKEYLLEEGRLNVETQTAYLLALAFDLLPEGQRENSATHLVDNIRASNWHLSTGFIGISHLNPTLTLTGHADVAYRLLLQESYPSWLYPVLHGATTIWERWNGWTHQDGFFNPQMNSFNHYSLGSVGEWLFRHVAGIELDPETAGFSRFVLRPFIGSGLTHAKGQYRSIHGEISSEWSLKGKRLTWTVRIPANTQARLVVPCAPKAPVTESGANLSASQGLRVLSQNGNSVVCEATAGSYCFETDWVS